MATLSFDSVNGPQNIDYSERQGSPEESMVGDTFRVRRVFKVAWDDRWNFCQGLMGNATIATVGLTKYVQRFNPIPYTINSVGLTNSPWLFPASIESIRGVGPNIKATVAGVDISSYAECEISVNYEAITYNVIDDSLMMSFYLLDYPDESSLIRNVTIFYQPTAEYLTLPIGGFYWADGSNVRVTGSNGRIISATEIVMIWHRVPTVPSAIKNYIGTVNNATFGGALPLQDKAVLFTNGCPAETLLLTSVDLKPYRWFGGTRMYDITYKFKYFDPNGDGSAGHNHFLKYLLATSNTQPTYVRISSDGTVGGTPVYQKVDFTKLFYPG